METNKKQQLRIIKFRLIGVMDSYTLSEILNTVFDNGKIVEYSEIEKCVCIDEVFIKGNGGIHEN